MSSSQPILEVKNLVKHFLVKRGFLARPKVVKAVAGVSFSVKKGMTLGLVGESGCGKSTVARLILRLVEPTSGEIYFQGSNILGLGTGEMKSFRSKVQMVFQDHTSALDPRMTTKKIVGEPLEIQGVPQKEQVEQVLELLSLVGLRLEQLGLYPHQFSSGERQRIALARSLALNPQFLVLDEPVSALDLSAQAQILNLLLSLQEKRNLSYLFISHDLMVVNHLSDFIAVMYLGKIVELAPQKAIKRNPQHPYTQLLLKTSKWQERGVLKKKEIVNRFLNSSPGCSFENRCLFGKPICTEVQPELISVAKDHKVACHLISS